jgi:hypothetical protein
LKTIMKKDQKLKEITEVRIETIFYVKREWDAVTAISFLGWLFFNLWIFKKMIYKND